MTDSSGIEYFLHVDLLVREAQTGPFEEKVTEFLNRGGFNRIVKEGDDPSLHKIKDTKRLVLALKSVERIQYKPRVLVPSSSMKEANSNEYVFRYVHLWHVPHVRELDLVGLMRLCAADKLYRELDGLVVEEMQDFVARVQTKEADVKFDYFMRGIRRFRSFELGQHLFNTGVLLRTLATLDILPAGQFQSVTGTLNSVLEFWNTRLADPDALARLRTSPELLAAADPDAARVLKEFIDTFLAPADSAVANFGEVLQPYLERAKLTKAASKDNNQLVELKTYKDHSGQSQ